MIATFTLPVVGQTVKLKVLHNFGSSQDGNHPAGSPVIDGKGNLYGVTGGGPGLYGYGIAFELIPRANGTWHETILHTFGSGDDGAYPWGALLLDNAGNLYGTLYGDLWGCR